MLYTDLENILDKVRDSLERDDLNGAVAAIEALRPPDQADLFQELDDQHQTVLLPRLDPEDSADILEELEDEEAARIVATLPREMVVRILNQMEPDEAADVLGEMTPADAQSLVDDLDDPAEVRPLLLHPEDTAGGLMTSEFLALGRRMTVAEALPALRNWKPDADDIHEVYVVDRFGRLAGMIGMRRLLGMEPSTVLIDRDGLYERGSLSSGMGWQIPRLPGLGDANWGEIFSNLYRVGYDGDCIIEHEDRRFEATDQLIKRGFLVARNILRPYIPKGY